MSSFKILETKSEFNKETVKVFLTDKSTNRKTGDIPQINYLPNDKPTDSIKNNNDSTVCGTCIRRPSVAKENGVSPCYVNKGFAQNAIYKSEQKGKMKDISKAKSMKAWSVRLGAWGDSASVSEEIYFKIRQQVKEKYRVNDRDILDYTHNWQTSEHLKPFAMASVEGIEEARQAWNSGWKTYRVIDNLSDVSEREILCPNITKRIQCRECKLCNGSQLQGKSICITNTKKYIGKKIF